MSSPERKKRIETVWQQGYQAAHNGRNSQSNPYHDMDRGHWHEGWMEYHRQHPTPETMTLEERIAKLEERVETLARFLMVH